MMRVAVVAAALACGLAQAAYDPNQPESKYDLKCLADGGTIDSEGFCTNANLPDDKLPNKELKNYFFEAYDGQHNCVVSTKIPDKPRSLSFCHKFNDKACCPPVMDDENAEIFDQLTSLGLSCRLRGDIRDDPIAKWYCMNCDPEQPQYIRNAGYPGLHELNPGDGIDGRDGKEQVMLVSRSWARGEFGADPVLDGPQGRFRECGLLKSSPCLDHAGNAIDDRDRYTCGDDPYFPAWVKVTKKDGTVDIDLSIENFMMDIDMGPPALDDYGYKLIADCDNFCPEDVIKAHYLTSDTMDKLLMPDCKRNQAQLQETEYEFNSAVFNVTNGGDKQTFRQFFCAAKGGASCFATDGTALKCEDAATRQDNPCCCATWTEEKCFSAASGLFSTASVAALAAVAAAMHLLLA